eukprot:15434168-Alexandrium_andersonii.AAC.1
MPSQTEMRTTARRGLLSGVSVLLADSVAVRLSSAAGSLSFGAAAAPPSERSAGSLTSGVAP